MITLVLYTCRRPERAAELLATLPYCLDRQRIERLVISDDNSDYGDVAAAAHALENLFPGKPLTVKHRRNQRGFTANWRAGWQEVSTPYVLQLEDDWVFTEPGPYLSYALFVMEQLPDVGQVAFSYLAPGGHYVPTEPDQPAWERVKLPGSGWSECLLFPLDHHWPGYTNNPNLTHLKRVRERLKPPYPDTPRDAEILFGRRWKEAGLRTAFLPRAVMRHTGALVSAFELNQTPR